MLKRSANSSLTDTQLVLIDPMFNSLIPPNALRASNYASAFNVRYSHSLSDQLLARTLSALVDEGVIQKLQRHNRTVYGLTDEGGATWETERKPDWSAYCFVAVLPSPSKTKLEITTFSWDRAEKYLRLAAEQHAIGAPQREHLAWTTRRRSQIYWKRDVLPRSATILMDSALLNASVFVELASTAGLWGSIADFRRS
jgi:hypothetical protein